MSELTQREKELGYCEEAQTYCSIAEEMYKQGKADTIEEIYNELLYVESKFRSMLLNTSQESDLIEWVDLNGKLMAITTIKHMIQDKLKEQKNE